MADLIDRQAAIDAMEKAMPSLTTPDGSGEFDRDIYIADEAFVDCMQIINELPSAQPEYSMDEWCTDCTEYDQEHHCCPRFNRVIREAVDEVKNNQWILCKDQMPEEYGEYLITWTYAQGKRSYIAICEGEVTSEYDYEHERFKFEWLLEDYIKAYPRVRVVAWMPLPESYRGDEQNG